jgi:hypothetical protein
MNIYICQDHEGHYPVGVCSVIVAEDEDMARLLLQAELREHGLRKEEPFTLRRINTDKPKAFVILDGDY